MRACRQQRLHPLEQRGALGGACGEVGEQRGAGQVVGPETGAAVQVEQHHQRVQAAGHHQRGGQQCPRTQTAGDLVNGLGRAGDGSHQVACGHGQRGALGIHGHACVAQRAQRQAGGGGRPQRALARGRNQHQHRIGGEQALRLDRRVLEHRGGIETTRDRAEAADETVQEAALRDQLLAEPMLSR